MPATDMDGRDMAGMIADIGRSPERYVNNVNQNIRRNGEIVWVAWTNTPLYDSEGRVKEILCIGNEVTERILAQRATLKALEAAENAGRARSEFLANVTHELITPLNPIIGLTDLLAADETDPVKSELISDIRTSAGRLLVIVKDLLELTRLEAAGSHINRQPLAPSVLLTAVVEAVRARADEKGLTVRCHTDPGIPEFVQGDSAHVRRILDKLIDNAVKFTEVGEIIVSLNMVRESESTIRLAFTVADSGIGISASMIDHLSADFTQADGSSIRQHGGLGLGLTLVRKLVKLLDGRLSVESVEGEGSSFTVELPFELMEAEV